MKEEKEKSKRCMVLCMNKGTKKWEISYICANKERAWRMAHSIIEQEHFLGNKQDCIVVTEDDYDSGKFKPLRAPIGFDFGIEVRQPKQEAKTTKITEVTVPTIASKPSPIVSGFQPKQCSYCTSSVPSNGAAQFSHLKKHTNELVSKKVLTQEQGSAIRSIKLTPEMLKIFSDAFKGVKNETVPQMSSNSDEHRKQAASDDIW